MSREYSHYIIDLLSPWAHVTAKAMFGGFGLYRQGHIFAIIVDDTLYFKVGDSNRSYYEAAGSEPFTYEAKGRKKASMSYWRVPEEVLEDAESLGTWAEKAYRVGVSDRGSIGVQGSKIKIHKEGRCRSKKSRLRCIP